MGFSDYLAITLAIVGAFVGAYLGIRASLSVEQNRKPRLTILNKPLQWPYDYRNDPDPHPAKISRHLAVEIQNEEYATIWMKKVRRDTALQCKATVTFHSVDGAMVTSRMPGRWCDTDQPVDLEVLDPMGARTGYKVRDFNVARRVSTVDIEPNGIAKLDIAAKFDNEKCCYGWNNESYPYLWRHPLRRIPPGEYIVEIKVRSGQETAKKRFRLINTDADFRLEGGKRGTCCKTLAYDAPEHPLPCISPLHSQPGFQDFLEIPPES